MTDSYNDLIEELEKLEITASRNVLYVYDELMTHHQRGSEYHPERPSRIKTIHEYLTSSGLLGKMKQIPSRYATFEELCLAHDPELVKKVLSYEDDLTVSFGGDEMAEQKKVLFPFDTDTYICHSSASAAKLACGSVLGMIDEMIGGSSSENDVKSGTRS